ncbi:NAD(P)/FAD-dependent oxidoreductase [Halobacteriales archaeon SW_7_71_33]|nr:MAG: NAD(P)/FAD-dependent oxidoreductase [Halobacteriales archaeon SW_7_71_33]
MERVDVAVVGGGPGGSSAAWEAARHGADTLLVEKGVPRADRDEPGPDSTDAAGMLDYWVDIMGLDPSEFPDDVVLRRIEDAEFHGPNESVTLDGTGIDASYSSMGYTFHRARMDDHMRDRAESAGARYRVGDGVRSLEADADEAHVLELADGETVAADRLVLADGPQRTVTGDVLDQFLPGDVGDRLSAKRANHIAYQEYRRFPPELFDEDTLKFWWGYMPGETAYPWVFPNDGRVARVGLTMPIDLDLDAVEDRGAYALLDGDDDDRVPRGGEYVRRLIEREYGPQGYSVDDFPVVEDRGKAGGTETYPISSTRPIESPVGADVAVVGGAMGATSAFHEGGYHVAVRTGREAGRLAAQGRLARYNDAWRAAVGTELLRNVAFADIVEDYGPPDWDRAFRTASAMTSASPDENGLLSLSPSAGVAGLEYYLRYKAHRFRNRDGRYVQLRESEYRYT